MDEQASFTLATANNGSAPALPAAVQIAAAHPAAGAASAAAANIASRGAPATWSANLRSMAKHRLGGDGARNAARAPNYGMTPRRFTPLCVHNPQSPPAADQKKEVRDARIARGIKRAMWLIAIATVVNAGVAALQWHELHKANAPAKQASAANAVNRASLP